MVLISRTGARLGTGGIVAIAVAAYALLAWRLDFLCDDAYITFRYAENWASGHGLVYHPGIDEPVEGYSEFLWAILLGLGTRFDVGMETLSRVLSFTAGAGLVGLSAVLLARRFAGSPFAALGGALFVASASPVSAWATGGMATMPAAALALWLFARLHAPLDETRWRSRAVALGAIGAVLALIRADGALLVALVLGSGIVFAAVRADRGLLRAALGGASLAAAVFLAHMAWRWSFYGDWVPNTARVKVGMTSASVSRGLDYVISCLLAMPGLIVAVLAAPAGLWLARERVGGAAAIGALVVPVGVFAYSVTSGGDFMCFGRFVLPAVAFLGLGLGALLAATPSVVALGLGSLAIVGGAAATFDVHPFPESVRRNFDVRHNQRSGAVKEARSELAQWRNMAARAKEWGRLGRGLRAHASEGASLVYGAVGAVGYFSGLFIHDTNGLVTREVALLDAGPRLRSPGHDKMVPPTFFLKDRPSFLMAGVGPGTALVGAQHPLGPVVVLGPSEKPGEVVWVVEGP